MRTGIKRVFSINSHTTNAYPITKKVHETDPTYQNYMNGFFKAFRVPYNYDKMTLKNAVTKGVKAWRDRRVGYWLCIDPKTGEYYLLTSASLAVLNGLKAVYRLPAVYYRAVLTRDWNVKLGPHVIGTHLDTSAYIKDLDGFFDRIEAKNKVELRKAIKKRLSL